MTYSFYKKEKRLTTGEYWLIVFKEKAQSMSACSGDPAKLYTTILFLFFPFFLLSDETSKCYQLRLNPVPEVAVVLATCCFQHTPAFSN